MQTIANITGETAEETQDGVRRFLGFSLASEDYAVPLLRVKEVIAMPEITPVPKMPEYFLGVMNLRGQIISVVDLRRKLNIKEDNTEETCVIICDLAPLCLGVVVSAVSTVWALTQDKIGPRPEIGGGGTKFVLGVAKLEKKMILIIDIPAALGVQDYLEMQSSEGGSGP